MPATPHVEKHFTAGDAVRDVVIGMSDGLTVPFALAAGLTGAISSSRLIVTAGFAEIAAGSIAMGLGGYLAARGDAEHYTSERTREEREIVTMPEAEAREVQEIFETYGLTAEESSSVVNALRKRPQDWVNFMMRFELGLEKPEPKRARSSALTIAGAYIGGGMVPLAPYFFTHSASAALPLSVAFTILALGAFGWVYFMARSALPQLDGTLKVSGLAGPVRVIRDGHGVPTIEAASLDDLFFAQGFVTAQDRMWQMDVMRRFADHQSRLRRFFRQIQFAQPCRAIGIDGIPYVSFPAFPWCELCLYLQVGQIVRVEGTPAPQSLREDYSSSKEKPTCVGLS
jgi:VIT1/CCC1 family predicted Fe2+/Mn2+ transporter